MSIVRKKQSISKIIQKSQSSQNIAKKEAINPTLIQAVRQPSVITEMGDVNFGELNPTKDGQIISYDAATDKFVLITADELLEVSAQDNVIPENLISAIESEITTTAFDGGGF